jgi:hypothetical protein
VCSLPLTFQHAVIKTGRLGFRYPWADSLRITQNSTTDWQHESAIIGEIYRGKIYTIVAFSASDSQEGLFSSRNLLIFHPCRLNDEIGLPGCRSLPHYYLSSREWVVQNELYLCEPYFTEREPFLGNV